MPPQEASQQEKSITTVKVLQEQNVQELHQTNQSCQQGNNVKKEYWNARSTMARK
jgi:hypothetical protein